MTLIQTSSLNPSRVSPAAANTVYAIPAAPWLKPYSASTMTMNTVVAPVIAASAALPNVPMTMVSAIPNTWSPIVAAKVGMARRVSVPPTSR
jgi:hypothetical protein